MANDHELPRWGRRARSAFRNVFSPLVGLSLLLKFVVAFAVAADHVPSGPLVAGILGVVVIGVLLSGALWLCAEVRTGYRESRR